MGFSSQRFLWLLAAISIAALLVGLFDTKTLVAEHRGTVDRVVCGTLRGTPGPKCDVTVQVDIGATFWFTDGAPNAYAKGQSIKVLKYQRKYTRRIVWEVR